MNLASSPRYLGMVALLIVMVSLAACGQIAMPAGPGIALNAPQSQPTVAAIVEGVAPTGAVLDTLELTGIDVGFTPNHFDVAEAGRYTVQYHNAGNILHDVLFADGAKITVQPGETLAADIMVPDGGLTFYCSLPGHKEAGMAGTIGVAGQPVASEGGAEGHGGPAVTTDVAADPNAPPYEVVPPQAPKLLEGTVHDIELNMVERKMTVAAGFVQEVWTFGNTAPGPVIRVKVGDTVRIHLKNDASSRMPHSIDFHSSMVAWNDEMTSISPGEEKIYEFEAKYAGVWMYHCGTAPALHHIANGMYGMMIVEPKEGLPPVDQEFALVQGEWYLGPQGEPGNLTKAAASAPAPDYVVFNGVANQYADNPIQIETGKRVRVFVLNAGPSIDSSFHIVGTIFDTVIKEGVTLSPQTPGQWGSQAVDLSPAQGAIVEFTMDEDGLYPIVTHAFNFVGRGALGLFQAGDGDPKN